MVGQWKLRAGSSGYGTASFEVIQPCAAVERCRSMVATSSATTAHDLSEMKRTRGKACSSAPSGDSVTTCRRLMERGSSRRVAPGLTFGLGRPSMKTIPTRALAASWVVPSPLSRLDRNAKARAQPASTARRVFWTRSPAPSGTSAP